MRDMPESRFLTVVCPVLDDWESLSMVVGEIDGDPFLQDWRVRLIVIVDGSSRTSDLADIEWSPLRIKIDFVRLRANVGHQRAIALELAYAARPPRADRRDGCWRKRDPCDLRGLLAAHDEYPHKLVRALRARRSEGWIFAIFYLIDRTLFRGLPATSMSFNNYLLISRSRLNLILYSGAICARAGQTSRPSGCSAAASRCFFS
jgi:hypothetical protein